MPETNGNGNGSGTAFTVKEMLQKLDYGQQEILKQLKVVSDRQIAHENQSGHASNNHAQRLDDVEAWQDRKDGSLDIVKWFFGASAVSFLLSLITLYQMLTGGTK